MNPRNLQGWVFLFAVLTASPVTAAEASQGFFIHDRSIPNSMPVRSQGHAWERRISAPKAVAEPGLSCTFIDFEGIGNLSPIPEFEGITSPDWLGIIDADAGGTGNIAFEPSPETIAFWLGGPDGTGSSRDILFTEPAAVVELFYASLVSVRLDAFDKNGVLVAQVTGASNFGLGPGGDPTGQYNRWDPLRLAAGENRIVRIRVSGAINQTGIDNLKVCRRVGVDTVEFTQAIQQLQELDALKADLAGDGQPPVPIVRNKPAVLRVYTHEVQAVTTLKLEAVLGGRPESRDVVLQPGCTRDKMRRNTGGCASADFYFTPSGDTYTVDLKVSAQSGGLIESHTFQLRPRSAEPLVLGAVRVCDARDANGVWQCADDYLSRLAELSQLMRKIAPTASVRVVDSGETIRREGIDANGDGTVTSAEEGNWWKGIDSEIDDLYGLFDGIRDFLGLEDRRYFGMTRPGIQGFTLGRAAGIPSHGAAARTTSTDLGVDVSQDTVAHETFHSLGRKHTNTGVPAATRAPGCSGVAPDSTTDWPFGDNRIQSGNGLEVGFDVAERRPLPPETTFDIMSYCAPVWITPHTYTHLLSEALGRSASRRAKATAAGTFWLVAGTIDGAAAKFDPVFALPTAGPLDEGSGSYRIEVRNAGGGALFTRRFTPVASVLRLQGGGEDIPAPPTFSELIPVQAGAASLVVLSPSGATAGSVSLAGAAPSVTITSPRAGETVRGSRDVIWTVADPDSTKHTAWVQYSADGGSLGSWRTLGFVSGTRLKVNFDGLPGAAGKAVIRVTVSDGAKSGSVVSSPFTVPTKGPSVAIFSPGAGTVFQSSQAVWLQGSGFDAEDGALDRLSWRSDLDGALGDGPSLSVPHLSPGVHRITLTGTDSEGKTASREIQLVVAGAGPTLDLQARALDTLPTTCVEATVTARAGSVPLSRVEYSLDGGEAWSPISITRLPYRFIVPGKGFFHLVARAFDVSGQLAAEDTQFFTDDVCQQATPPPPDGPWLTTSELPGFRFKVRITAGGQAMAGAAESDCIGETLCVSGSRPGRSELFARIIGPRPNGRLWVNLVRFSPSDVEVWIEQTARSQINYYHLAAVPRESSVLTGLVDTGAFLPPSSASRATAGLVSRSLEDPGIVMTHPEAAAPQAAAGGTVFTSPAFPGYRFRIRILSGGQESPVRLEKDCLAETACFSGALPGRSELFFRLIGPRPNGFLWVNLVRFTTSRVEIQIEQTRTGKTKSYVLPEIPRGSDQLDGLVDKEAFK